MTHWPTLSYSSFCPLWSTPAPLRHAGHSGRLMDAVVSRPVAPWASGTLLPFHCNKRARSAA